MMNPLRGEAKFESGGQVYTLALSVNEICEIEEKYDAGFGEILSRLDIPGVDRQKFPLMRSLVTVFLSKYHPGLSESAVGDIMSDAGVDVTIGAIVAVAKAAFPQKEIATPGKRKAGAATG